MAKIKIAIAGGGTGGHLFPALAIASEIESRVDAQLEFFGTAKGPEARIVPDKGYTFHPIWIKGFPRRLKPEIFLLPVKLLISVIQCMRHLIRFWPDCLVATGGYVCLPFMIAGRLLGIPIVLHEQNSLPGITTKIGASWAKAVFYSFEKSADYFKNHRDASLSGNPARTDLGLKPKEDALKELGLDVNKNTILVFGGSQGAATLNKAMLSVMSELFVRYNVIWGCGKGNVPSVIPPQAVVKEFFYDKGTVYCAADLAFTRAGAMTLAELAAVGLPAVLIPFPYAADDHQRLNAEPWAENGAAEMVLDKDFSGKVLLEKTQNLLNDPEKLENMSISAKSFHKPEAAKMIVDKVIYISERKTR